MQHSIAERSGIPFGFTLLKIMTTLFVHAGDKFIELLCYSGFYLIY